MEAFKIIISLVISGLIGYCTNYIAVKMLFRPRTEKHLFGKRVPFTPGIIPKNKPRLAKALGNAVGEQLLTGSDLKDALASENTANAAADKLIDAMLNDRPLGEGLSNMLGEEHYASAKTVACEKITETVTRKLRESDISSLIVREGTAAIKQKTSGSMLAMFINDDLIASLAAPLADRIDIYIKENADTSIGKAVGDELEKLMLRSPAELAAEADLSRESVKKTVSLLISRAVEQSADGILSTVDIPKMVEQRVNAMNVEQVEELVMSVMKHELNAVINLGALIGLIIGVLNVIVQRL